VKIKLITKETAVKNRARIKKVINSSKITKIANKIKIPAVAKINIARVAKLIQILKSIHKKYA
jgi:translation initiation factor 2 gamma subunit (eIF-2gamma)